MKTYAILALSCLILFLPNCTKNLGDDEAGKIIGPEMQDYILAKAKESPNQEPPFRLVIIVIGEQAVWGLIACTPDYIVPVEGNNSRNPITLPDSPSIHIWIEPKELGNYYNCQASLSSEFSSKIKWNSILRRLKLMGILQEEDKLKINKYLDDIWTDTEDEMRSNNEGSNNRTIKDDKELVKLVLKNISEHFKEGRVVYSDINDEEMEIIKNIEEIVKLYNWD